MLRFSHLLLLLVFCSKAMWRLSATMLRQSKPQAGVMAFLEKAHRMGLPMAVASSATSASLCTNTLGLPTPQGTCNFNQGADPFTGPDGTLYIAYSNFNNTVTGSDNRNQVLLTKSTDGGQSFGAPVKVADYFELPVCLAFQNSDPFRACVPEKGTAQNSVFRASNYPAGAVNPRNPSQKVTIPAATVPKFSAGSSLKQAVKGGGDGGGMGGGDGGGMGGGGGGGMGGGGGF